MVQFKEGPHVWRKILEAREEVEHEIWWEMKRGFTNVWHDNWTRLGALYHVVPPDFYINEELQEVADSRDDDGWNEQLLDQSFPEDILDHIRHEVPFENSDEFWDKPWWMPTSFGKFMVSSAWKMLRHSVTVQNPTGVETIPNISY